MVLSHESVRIWPISEKSDNSLRSEPAPTSNREENGREMARESRNRKTTETVHWHTWQLLIRNPRFWEDLYILHDKLLDWLRNARAKHEKFRLITTQLLYEYDSFKERLERKWGISPIPIWAALCVVEERPSRKGIETLEELYEGSIKERSVSPPPVQKLRYHLDDLLDVRLDLKRPLYELLRGVEVATKGLLLNKRQRFKEAEFELKVFDLREYDKKSLRSIARELKTPLSTVRSAYLAAKRKIGIVTKKTDPPSDPGPIYSCPDKRCKLGERLCDAHQAYIKQDEIYLREYLSDPSLIQRLNTSVEDD
jgi:hypothetical protein